MLVSCSWLWSLIWGTINMLRETLLKKTNFSFASGIICRYLGIRASVYFPFSVLRPSWLEPCRSCAVCHSLWEFICVWKTLFPWSYPFPLPLQSFCLLICIDPEPWGEWFDGDILFRTECSQISYYLHIVQLWVGVLPPICCRRKLLQWWLSKALI